MRTRVPVEAIYYEDDLPEEWSQYYDINVHFFDEIGSPGGASRSGPLGIAYTVGAVVYGFKKPNPSPKYFGFHEIFHVCTVIGFVCHSVAVYLTIFLA